MKSMGAWLELELQPAQIKGTDNRNYDQHYADLPGSFGLTFADATAGRSASRGWDCRSLDLHIMRRMQQQTKNFKIMGEDSKPDQLVKLDTVAAASTSSRRRKCVYADHRLSTYSL